MSLFNMLRKSTSSAQKQYNYILSDHFRGYKKFPMCVCGEGDAEKNNSSLKNINLEGQQIVFVQGFYDGNQKKISVYVCEKHIGTIYDEKQISEFESGIITKVYAKMEDERIITKKGVLIRPRIFLFVKKGN